VPDQIAAVYGPDGALCYYYWGSPGTDCVYAVGHWMDASGDLVASRSGPFLPGHTVSFGCFGGSWYEFPDDQVPMIITPVAPACRAGTCSRGEGGEGGAGGESGAGGEGGEGGRP
jgi:hypothetical protein